MGKIPRRGALAEPLFIEEFVRANRPVIITDAMTGWPATSKWTPAYLASEIGDASVQVYDHLFTLLDIDTVAGYLARNFGLPAGSIAQEYVRGYVKFKDVDFVWADELFAQLAADWSHPYFFPRDGFVLPRCAAQQRLSPVDDVFPYKGLFLSGRGARTRLHRDPYGTEAVLCQFYGEKRLLIYAPEAASALMCDGEFADPANVNATKFPHFHSVQPVYDDVLHPGEILFIPAGWLHDVETLSDSISVTWNFVHQAHATQYQREVGNAANTFDRDMLSYLS